MESIVLALRERALPETRLASTFPRTPSRPSPMPPKVQDLEEALDELIARYPKTLSYLAK